MKKCRVALMGGMGYPVTETPAGMPRLKARLEASGAEVLLVNWSHRTEVYNFMHGFDGFKAYAGDSLGAGSAGQYPDDLKVPVDYAAGFQPSEYDSRTRKTRGGIYVQDIAPNIVRAHCVFDPWWIDTAGLGYARWVINPNNKTKLLITEHRGAHPDDWGVSQDAIYAELMHLWGAA